MTSFAAPSLSPVQLAYFDPAECGQPSRAIVWALESVTGRPVVDLDPLSEFVDVEALDRLVGHAAESTDGDTPISLEFAIGAWRVVVDGCRVTIYPLESRAVTTSSSISLGGDPAGGADSGLGRDPGPFPETDSDVDADAAPAPEIDPGPEVASDDEPEPDGRP